MDRSSYRNDRVVGASVISLLIGVALLMGKQALLSQTCSVSDFGPLDQDPIEISGNWTLGPSCLLNFGARKVILSGTLNVNEVTIHAADLTITPTGRIKGAGTATSIILTARDGHTGSASIEGIIDHNDSFFGGNIQIIAGGSVRIAGGGMLRARGTVSDADGGVVVVVAEGPIVLDGNSTSIDTSSGSDAFGGVVALISRGSLVEVFENIDARGGSDDGGIISIRAETDVISSGRLDVSARCFDGFCGFGGVVLIFAGGAIDSGQIIDARGPDGTGEDGGGDGGIVTLLAGTTIDISHHVNLSAGHGSEGGFYKAVCGDDYTQAEGRTRVEGRKIESCGGIIEIQTGGSAILSGTHEAGGGKEGCSGSIQVVAARDIIVSDNMDCSANFPTDGIHLTANTGSITCDAKLTGKGKGPTGEGSKIFLTAGADIEIQGAHLDVSGNSNTGLGGTVTLDGGSDVIADANTRIRANGSGTTGKNGTGGVVDIVGCQVVFPSNSQIRARGDDGGEIAITAFDSMNLGGIIEATTGGAITLFHHPDAPPDLTGASINPPPTIIEDSTLPACVVFDLSQE